MKLQLNLNDIEKICSPFLASVIKTNTRITLTRNGNVAIILNDVAGGSHPLIGVYYSGSNVEDGEWFPVKWTKEGNYITNQSRGVDLIFPESTPELVA